MDFALTPELQDLQTEVREFLRREVPAHPPEPQIVSELGTDEEYEFTLAISKKLSERGWYTAAWPKEHGGLGFGPMQAQVLSSELGSHGVSLVNSIGMLVASLLMKFGSDEQRKRFLPDIAACNVIWGEGYSEPDAGSDLASLATTALRDGDHYVINGTKIWTGAGHRSQWMFVFSRTNLDRPKHESISYVLVDMQNQGVTVIPLENMAGQVTFAQEFFEDVRTPADNVIGEEGTGWQQRRVAGNAGVNSGPDSPWRVQRHFEQLVEHCKQPANGGPRLFDDPLVRQKLARTAIEIELAQTLSWRNAWLASRKELTAREGEVTGVLNRFLNQGAARTAVEILGLHGTLLPENERWVPLRGWFADAYMFTVASTIYGGTVDIHRNLLAQRGLGLPRG